MKFLKESAIITERDGESIKNIKPDQLGLFLKIVRSKGIGMADLPNWMCHMKDAIEFGLNLDDFFKALSVAENADQIGEYVKETTSKEKYLAKYPSDDQYDKVVNESTNDIDAAINEFKQRYAKYLDKETFEDALAVMSNAKSAWEVRDIANVYTNLNFYRFKDTDEIVGHGGVKPAKTANGNDSKSRTIRFLGDREYENTEPATYFDKTLAQPYIDKILDESANPLKDAADKHKKKQKGLSPFCTLNTNAGDVEKGISIFNNACGAQGECIAEAMQVDSNYFEKAYSGSYYTIEGAGGDLEEWKKGYQELLDKEGIGQVKEWITFKGKDMNDAYNLFGSVAYPDDLTFLAFPLDGLDVSKLAMFKLRMGDRWFDDIVDNNTFHLKNENLYETTLINKTFTDSINNKHNVNNKIMENINIRTALIELDKDYKNPCFVNMYDAANLSEEDKLHLANMLVNDDKNINDVYEFLSDKQNDQHIIKYKDMLIEYDFYNQGEYTIQYQGDDVWFDTLDAAKKFIDELRTSNESLIEAKETEEKIVHKYVIDSSEIPYDDLKVGDIIIAEEDIPYAPVDDCDYYTEEELARAKVEIKDGYIIIPKGTKIKLIAYTSQYEINGVDFDFYWEDGVKISSKAFEKYWLHKEYGIDDDLYQYLKSRKQIDDYIKHVKG